MKIRRLQIQGFKSFVDPTDFRFDQDITGVVGPNGCGKSNIVDAIRWVMGERSTKNLRGRTMDDVIFSGSEGRAPAGMAEVTLTFDNADGMAPPEYAAYPEIAIGRRLFRSVEGENDSEYYINRTQVRLKDVEDFFLGTGVGTKAYSIVEQGKIGSIVNSRPEDRRLVIEEAAGITKYRARRRATERQMDSTRQNLLRVSDVLTEIEKNLASLKRQAEKAERYKRYRSEMRDLDLWVASHRFLELRAQGVGVELRTEQARETHADAETALGTAEAEVEALRAQLVTEEGDTEKLQGRAYEVDNQVRLLESELVHRTDELRALQSREAEAEGEVRGLDGQAGGLGGERAELEASLAGHESEVVRTVERLGVAEAALGAARAAQAAEEAGIAGALRRELDASSRGATAEGALRSLERQVREAQDHLDRSRSERAALEIQDGGLEAEAQSLAARMEDLARLRGDLLARRAEGESRLTSLRAELSNVEENFEAVRAELTTKRSRFESLVEIRARRESLTRGPRAAMERGGSGLGKILADAIDVPADMEVAVAAVLGDRTEGVLVGGIRDAADLARWLASEDRGRATALPASARAPGFDRGDVPSDESVLGAIRPRIQAAPEVAGLCDAVFEGVLVVRSLEDAVRLWEAGSLRHTLVTLQGEIVEPSGALTGGGRPAAAAGLLSAKREIDTLEAHVEDLDGRYRELSVRQATLRASVNEVVGFLGELATSEHREDLDEMERTLSAQRIDDARMRISDRLAVVRTESAEAAGRLAEAAHERGEAERVRVEALADQQIARAEASRGEAALAGSKDEAERALAALTDFKVGAAQAREKAEGVRGAIGRVESALEDLRARIERLRGEVARGAAKQGETAARLLLGREELQGLVTQAREAQEAVALAREACDRLRGVVSEREARIRQSREAVDAAREAIRDLEVEAREIQLKAEHLGQNVLEKHRVELPSVIGDYHVRPPPEATVHDRVLDLQRLVDRMGEINLTAIEEYQEQSKRAESLAAQKQDLEKALGDIESAIRNLNRESRRRFREAFDAVNERFEVLFPKLFRGGRAKLELVGEEDLLEAGVEIVAQPPGKRLGSIELMSGGEKALTAVSLIFAIFQWKPSPFCLLDEVDAPLDEANVDRFGELVRSMTERSQFIVITHSKRTMQIADGLYGITMQEPGVSRTVSVKLKELTEAKASAAAAA